VSDLITICIPTYRRPSLLLSCLQTCFMQDYRPLEIDISDNSPDDQTGRLIAAVRPPPGITLRYWRNDPPLGPVGSVRKLFAEARAQRLLLMHDDDTLLPGAVTALDTAFRMAPDVIIAYGMLEVIDERGELLPEVTERDNRNSRRTPEYAGVRRDLLACALWKQIPHNGYLINTAVARQIGYRDRAEIGLAVDTDFGIRLARAYRDSGAFAFISRMTSQFRTGHESQRFTERDTVWKLYDEVIRFEGLSPEEEQARDWLLQSFARAVVIENALARRRRAALRVFFSRHYPHREDWARKLYILGLLVMPRTFSVLRRAVGAISPQFVAPRPLPAISTSDSGG
jgi:glycosyltransferase involved in cell wall biosynthesis